MGFITKINSYYNDKGIEIQEEELISGKMPAGRTQYTAMITIKVQAGEESYGQPISAKFHAIGIEDAFKKAEKELQKEIKNFEDELKKQVEEAKEESRPGIIKPGDV